LRADEVAALSLALRSDPVLRHDFIELLNLDAALADLAHGGEQDDSGAIGELTARDLAGDGLPDDVRLASSSVKPQSPVLGLLGGAMNYISHSRTLMFWLVFGALGLYFVGHFGVLLIGRYLAQNAPEVAHDGGAGTEKHGPANGHSDATSGKIVAQLTDAVDCQWQLGDSHVSSLPSPLSALPLGTEFRAGQKLNLAAGLAELAFDSGAKVILHGPAQFNVADALGGHLQIGKLTAKVPHSAAGFTVATPGGKVVDLGTEFGVKVNDEGHMDVVVYVGNVQIQPGSGGAGSGGDQPKAIQLHAGQAISVAPNQPPKSIPAGEQHFIRDLAPLGDKTKAEVAYVEFMKSLKPVVWFRMEGKEDERVLHDEMGGPDAKLNWDGPGNPFVKGPFGKALWLRGDKLKDYAILPDYPKAEHGKLSVSAWVYADSRPDYATIASNWEGAQGAFHFGLSGDAEGRRDLWVELRTQNGKREGPGHPFPLYAWQHVAFAFDGSTARLYRQGREVANGRYRGLQYLKSSTALAIGACLDPASRKPASRYANFWDGKLSEVAIFNAVLSPEHIQKLANFVPR
jgi:hypothetical protein